MHIRTLTRTHAHTHILAHTHKKKHTNKHTQRTSPPPPQELAAALGQRRALALGMALQYGLMPALAAAAASLLALPAPLAAGVVLLFSCPGGTASNLVTHLAGGDVGLSVLMTSASTLAAVVATPALTAFYAGALVPVDAGAMAASALLLVLAPCLGGRCARGRATVRAHRLPITPRGALTRARGRTARTRARGTQLAPAPRACDSALRAALPDGARAYATAAAPAGAALLSAALTCSAFAANGGVLRDALFGTAAGAAGASSAAALSACALLLALHGAAFAAGGLAGRAAGLKRKAAAAVAVEVRAPALMRTYAHASASTRRGGRSPRERAC